MKVTCYLILFPVFLFTSFCKTQSKGGGKISQSEYSMKTMALAGIDTLKISEQGIAEKYWKLTVILSDTVKKNDQFNQEPHIILTPEGSRLSGSGGCNKLKGVYQLREGNQLSFSEIGTTKMACLDMKTEIKLLEILAKVDNYLLKGDTLEFFQANLKIARFEAVHRH